MIPTVPAHGSIGLPDEATYWMPRSDDISEDGIGYFRGTWLIRDERVRLARAVVREERRITDLLAGLPADAARFDELARAVESGYGDAGDPSGYGLTPVERRLLGECVSGDEPAPLEGLELGVAGLTYALATVRIIPAASCRGHVGDRAWSTAPVVLFAATRFRAEALQRLAATTGCRFDIDPARADLLCVSAASITQMMDLAGAVLAARSTFVQPRARARGQGHRQASEQAALF